MKKVLFCATVESHILFFHIPFIKWFKERGYEVHVATKLAERKKELIDIGVIVHDICFERAIFSLDNIKATKQLINIMKINSFKLVHVHTPIASFLCRYAARVTDTNPVLYTAHGFHFYKGAPFKYWLIYYTAEWIAAHWCDGLITINEEDYTRAKRFRLRRKDSVYLVNGVGIDTKKYYKISKDEKLDYRKSLGLKEDDFVLITVAELIPRKNYKVVFDAISQLKDRDKIKYLVVGYGEIDEHINYVKDLGIDDNIIFLGYRTDINELINISDIAILMSKHEGLPKFLQEALAVGKPIITSNVRGNRDLVENCNNGYVVDINNVMELQNRIYDLLGNRTLINKFGDNSINISKRYKLENVICDYESIYYKYLEYRDILNGEITHKEIEVNEKVIIQDK